MSKQINIGGRLHSTEQGNVITGANEVLDDTKGKKQNVINADVDAELLRLDQSKQNNLTFDNTPTENSNNPVKSSGVYAADKALSDAIEAILILIPSAATALNQLADKNFVNSSIATDTATFRGTSETGLSEAQFLEWANSLTHDMNDYVFWQTIDEAGNTLFKRYKWNGTQWLYEYTLNNSSFTADQWAAIMSGITSALVEKLNDLPTAAQLITSFEEKQDVLTFDNVPVQGSSNPVKSGGVYSAIKDVTDLIPAEATNLNQLADKAYVLAQILAATPAFKGQFETLVELQDMQSPKAGDLGIVRTKDSDGYDVFTFYQYLNNQWNVFYILSHHLLNKPATTGTTGEYPYNGMGRVVVPKKMVNGVNTLTHEAFEDSEGNDRENTIYVIQYDFTLDANITVPANCVLEFDGGSLSGSNNTYTITGNGTIITYNSYDILKGIQVAGTFNNDSVTIDIFDDTDWAIKMAKSVYISKNIEMIAGKIYTQNTTLTINNKYRRSHINGHGAEIECLATNSILFEDANNEVAIIRIENFLILSSSTSGTAINFNGRENQKIKQINIENIRIGGFDTGIIMSNLTESTFKELYIANIHCIKYVEKSANVNIENSMLYCTDNSIDSSYGVRCNAETSGNFPEGFTISNTCFYGFGVPLKVNDIYVLNVYSCFFDSRKVNGVDTNKTIELLQASRIEDVTIDNCWLHNTTISLLSTKNINVCNCVFEKNAEPTHLIRRATNTIISNCIASSVDENESGWPNQVAFIVFPNDISGNTLVKDCFVTGFSLIANYSGNAGDQINAQFINISGTHNKTDVNPISVKARVINCLDLENTPYNNEVRMNNGVLQYWDGSAWQNVTI